MHRFAMETVTADFYFSSQRSSTVTKLSTMSTNFFEYQKTNELVFKKNILSILKTEVKLKHCLLQEVFWESQPRA